MRVKRLAKHTYKPKDGSKFPPPPVQSFWALGSCDCWCGKPFGHDWPGKADEAPHPR